MYALAQQFRELSDDVQVAGRVIFLNAAGAVVDDVSLSDTDVEQATNRLWAGNPANEALTVTDEDIQSLLSDGGER